MAKSNYVLSTQEFIIMKHDSVSAPGMMTSFTSELVLTNQNIIMVRKGVYRNVKETKKIPVNQIKVFNNKAQVFLTSVSYGFHQIEVYLANSQEKFIFTSKKDAERWVSKINQLVVDGDVEVDNSPSVPILGTEAITSVIKGTTEAFKDAFGFKSEKSNGSTSDLPEKVAIKCSYCGAPVSGSKNQVTRCLYCNSEHKL